MVFSGKTQCGDGFTAYVDENMKKALSIIISQWISDFYGNFRGFLCFGVLSMGYLAVAMIWVFGYLGIWVFGDSARASSSLLFFWEEEI